MAVALPLVVAWVLGIAGPAGANQTFTVTQLTDVGDGVCDSTCTLRDALSSANVLPGSDTIVLPAGTLRLEKSAAEEDSNATGDFDITDNVTIRGQGASATTVQSFVSGQRVFDVQGDRDLTLEDLGVAGGSGIDHGGGIRSEGNGQLTLARVAVHDNIVTTDNAVYAFGAGIFKGAGSLIVSDSAIYDNGSLSLSFYGGGMWLETASADIENTTITGNKVKYSSGGIHNDSGNAVTLAFDTITGNSSGATPGGIEDPSHYRIRSSIIAGNSGGNCQDGAGQDQGGNVGDAACGFNQPTDAIVTDPLLGALSGTQVPVMEPLPGSPALDRAVGPCPATDARGVARPQGAGCDSGAAELPVAGGLGGGGGSGKAPHLSIASKLSVAANLRTIALKLSCPASAGKCTGSVKIVGRFAKSAKKKTHKVTIASGRYSIAGGKHKTLKLKVTRAGRKAFRGHKSLSAKLTLSVTDAAGHKGTQSRTVKLVRPKKRH